MANWKEFIAAEKREAYFQAILTFLDDQRSSGKIIYPPAHQIYGALELTAIEDVKVVILGQDPYHGPDQAHGLSFSVEKSIKIPPSLKNIYKELATDIDDFTVPMHGNLSQWARQGVLLLNTVLTVEQGMAHSHAKIGWERFTDKVIRTLNEQRKGVIFMLWGSHAQKKSVLVDHNKQHVLKAPHPSPLSAHRGFFGCKHFSQSNQILIEQGQSPINWQID